MRWPPQTGSRLRVGSLPRFDDEICRGGPHAAFAAEVVGAIALSTGASGELLYVTEHIVRRSAAHDLTVVGSSREGVLQQFVFGSIPEAVGRRAESTVVMAKRNVSLPSRATGRLRRLRE